MSQMDEMKSNANDIVDGLRKLGPDRVVALSVHASKDLIVELHEKATALVEQLAAVGD